MNTSQRMIEDLKNVSGLVPPHTLPGLDPYAPKPKHDAILVTREATHGKFSETARVAQELKAIITQAHGWTNLNQAQREALDLIATKIGRVLSGNPNEHDHWDDIAGYGKLGAEACS